MNKDYDKRIITIPNILTAIRLLLIPFFVWQYLSGKFVAATIIVVVSGVTDVIDGIIARKFNMVSALGKALDPIADKLTQICVMLCLVRAFPKIWFPLALLIVKEFISGILGLMIITRTGDVQRGVARKSRNRRDLRHDGHAYSLGEYTARQSLISIIITVGLMITSFVLYAIRNVRTLRGLKREEKETP
ncbi:MAG: CDP-alcohol phosphatidyltransferase family protein [Christensenellales bacterium]